jgi:hypothetical protein
VTAMKKITSLFFAVVSTMFLIAGAAKAAEKFDTTNHDKMPALTKEVFDEGPALPCVVPPDQN